MDEPNPVVQRYVLMAQGRIYVEIEQFVDKWTRGLADINAMVMEIHAEYGKRYPRWPVEQTDDA